MSVLVVDASVATKVFLREPMAELAESAFSPSHRLYAPDFLLLEIHNVLLKKERRKELTFAQGEEARSFLSTISVQYHPFRSLLKQAYQIATETGCGLYDAIYIALAVQLDCPVVTADRRLYNSLSSGPFTKNVLWIEDLSKT